MSVIIVTGGSAGLGRALCRQLRLDGHHVFNLSPEPRKNEEYDLSEHWEGDFFIPCDVTRKDKCEVAVALVDLECMKLGLPAPSILINNAGVNEISWLERLAEMDWDRVMDTNAKGIFLMTQALLPWLVQNKGTVLNIVSNAAHMPMTGSLAYNASKAAAHIMTRQLAHELTRKHGITVFGIAPNKLAGTGMSRYIDSRVPEERGWTEEYAKEYQLRSLLAGEETDPARLAEFVGFLLAEKGRHKYLSGCILPYGA